MRGGTTDTWTETGINWNNQPAFGPQLSTQTLAAGTVNLWYNWDVTSFAQSKWAGNKLVSLVVKPITEGSTDGTAPAYTFDSKEYSGTKPVLQVTTSGGSATIAQVQLFYRYSADNANWGSWTSFATATSSPWSTSFSFPQGQGYYEFYSRATDSLNNVEPAPNAAQAFTHYTAKPAYYPLISFDGLYQKYDGSPKNVAVTTIPAGIAYSVSYNGSPTAPVERGNYTALVTITDQNYAGASATETMTIGEASASIALGQMDFIYDGSFKHATATTVPTGLENLVSFTYNGSTTLPVLAGTYNVIATISDPNYIASPAIGTLTIGKAAAPVTLSNLSFNYDGSPKTVVVQTVPAGLNVNVTYNGSSTAPSAVGTYDVVASINEHDYLGSASGTMTIAMAEPMPAPAVGLLGLMLLTLVLGGFLALRRRS